MNCPAALIEHIKTPVYYYDTRLLLDTLREVRRHSRGIMVHYAVKANPDRHLMQLIANEGFGADCVSAGEVRVAARAGFTASKIVFAGVGKTDAEIESALHTGIGCFNVESVAELAAINRIAGRLGRTADVAIRVNPDIDAHTDAKITTGLSVNKFGIPDDELEPVIDLAMASPHIHFVGLQYHIGSQITDLNVFAGLCKSVTGRVRSLTDKGYVIRSVNLGGGLGIDYDAPLAHPVPDFAGYFGIIHQNLTIPGDVAVHVELGRSITAQCGALVSRVTYIKETRDRRFAILDAGMNNLIRPALYNARHAIIRLGDNTGLKDDTYDIVGPVCESSDIFATGCTIPQLRRGDLVAILSSGAYGQSMASDYNLRGSAHTAYSDSSDADALALNSLFTNLDK